MNKYFVLLGILISTLNYSMEIEENGVFLEKSVISSIGYEESIQNTPKNIQVITKEEISEKNFKNVAEALNSSPLITITRDSVGESIQMRGSGINSKATVQVLVDGTSINPVDINHGTLPLNSISLTSIERIEILPGGNGVLHGDGFTGGLVNIITKSSVDKTGGYIGYRYGSEQENIFDIGTSLKINASMSFILNYSKENSHTNRDDEKLNSEHVDFTTLFNLSKTDKLKLQYSYYNKKNKTADLLTKKQLNDNSSQSGVDFDGSYLKNNSNNSYPLLDATGDILDKSDLRRDEFSFNYNKKFSDDFEFNLNGSYQKNTNDVTTKESTYANFGSITNPFDYRNYYADNIGTFTDEKLKINPSLKYNYMKNSYLILGYDYKEQKSKRDFDNFMDMYKTYNLSSKKESNGVYIFNKTSIDKFEFLQGYRREWTKYNTTKNSHYYHKVKPIFLNGGYVDTGLKTDYIKKSTYNDSYEFAINYLYSDTGNIYTRFEESFRTPAPTEFQDKDGTDYILNDLKPETNQTLEIGIKDYLLGSFISLNGFIGKTKNEIYYNEISHGKEWYYGNFGKTERKGVELNLEQTFGKFVFFENLAYIDAKIKKDSKNSNSEGNQVPYTPKINANLGTLINFTDNFSSILSFNYKDKYYLDKANKYEAQSFITLDLSLNYVFNNGLKIYGGINNILDRDNYDQEGISNNEILYDPANGRTFYSGFTYAF
ncbi:TonB-dependent receptor [uncultured Cetobacterium sp.]|uniref:TonB-dependent receptor n=1 Tax=uncultured Cetobacterium sp. TaxID=527638 RepID=UPI00262AFB62|nr:TonB-dependent receptor [uncultured Cetobacterium sp.]